tara:strand:+ start:1317 stop:1514 length:198 start_codon:yes stop_codon:yes gene_type:complete
MTLTPCGVRALRPLKRKLLVLSYEEKLGDSTNALCLVQSFMPPKALKPLVQSFMPKLLVFTWWKW